jgi:short subunit dehydrogenase-like uncharacterized protein
VTAPPLLEACERAGVHHLDLAGEVPEHEWVRQQGARLEAAGVMAMPGVGFGVVPTDCLAALAASRLPGATRLLLAYETEGGVSRGTLGTVLGGIHREGVVRRGGGLVPVRPGAEARRLDLGAGPRLVVTNPWRADLVSAHATTGIAEIETFSAFPLFARLLMRSGGLLDRPWARRLVAAALARAPEGPGPAELERGQTRVLAVASDGTREARVTLRGPDAYVFTARAAVAVARRVLEGEAQPGYRTPGKLLGPSLLSGLAGVEVSA